MPYKDHERKRQWEREHRQERNALRRRSLTNHSPEPSGIVVPLVDSNPAQAPVTSTNVAIGAMMGLALLLTVFIVIWRLGGSTDPIVST